MLFSIEQSILAEETLHIYDHSPNPPMFPSSRVSLHNMVFDKGEIWRIG